MSGSKIVENYIKLTPFIIGGIFLVCITEDWWRRGRGGARQKFYG